MSNSSNSSEYNSTIIRILGSGEDDLRFLANSYQEPLDPEEIFSTISSLAIVNDDQEWKNMYTHQTWWTSLARSSGGFLYGVSMEGVLHHNRSGKWKSIDLKCPDGLNDVFAASDDEVFAVGLNGERVRVLKGAPEMTQDSKGRRLNAVHGSSPDNVFTVGDKGVVFKFDGKDWKESKLGTKKNLLTVYCRSKTEVYVAGAQGTLFKWNGRQWEHLKSPEKITVTSLAWYRDQLYAAAGADGVLRLENDELTELKALYIDELSTIGEFLYGLGNSFVARFNGTGWVGGELEL